MRQPPPDRNWIEFGTRREVPPTALFYAPLILGVGILAFVLLLAGCGSDIHCGSPERPCFINPGGTTIYQQPTYRSTVTVTQRSASNPAPKSVAPAKPAPTKSR
jgi:hypothetical protein